MAAAAAATPAEAEPAAAEPADRTCTELQAAQAANGQHASTGNSLADHILQLRARIAALSADLSHDAEITDKVVQCVDVQKASARRASRFSICAMASKILSCIMMPTGRWAGVISGDEIKWRRLQAQLHMARFYCFVGGTCTTRHFAELDQGPPYTVQAHARRRITILHCGAALPPANFQEHAHGAARSCPAVRGRRPAGREWNTVKDRWRAVVWGPRASLYWNGMRFGAATCGQAATPAAVHIVMPKTTTRTQSQQLYP